MKMSKPEAWALFAFACTYWAIEGAVVGIKKLAQRKKLSVRSADKKDDGQMHD